MKLRILGAVVVLLASWFAGSATAGPPPDGCEDCHDWCSTYADDLDLCMCWCTENYCDVPYCLP